MAFSAKQRIVALVGQPYMKAEDIPSTRTLVAERGLSLHVPPDPFASIHYPGATLFLVVTKPETSVVFLPDQMEAGAGDTPRISVAARIRTYPRIQTYVPLPFFLSLSLSFLFSRVEFKYTRLRAVTEAGQRVVSPPSLRAGRFAPEDICACRH
jgi:hypothetical protein